MHGFADRSLAIRAQRRGADDGIRTRILMVGNHVPCQLSFIRVMPLGRSCERSRGLLPTGADLGEGLGCEGLPKQGDACLCWGPSAFVEVAGFAGGGAVRPFGFSALATGEDVVHGCCLAVAVDALVAVSFHDVCLGKNDSACSPVHPFGEDVVDQFDGGDLGVGADAGAFDPFFGSGDFAVEHADGVLQGHCPDCLLATCVVDDYLSHVGTSFRELFVPGVVVAADGFEPST